MLSLLYLGVKAKQYFVCSRCIFLDKKTLLKIWFNPALSPGRGGGGTPVYGLYGDVPLDSLFSSLELNQRNC